MDHDRLPITLAERCVQCLETAPSMEAWVEMCLEATVQEGAGPMLQATHLTVPAERYPHARAVMQSSAAARMESLRLLRRVKNEP